MLIVNRNASLGKELLLAVDVWRGAWLSLSRGNRGLRAGAFVYNGNQVSGSEPNPATNGRCRAQDAAQSRTCDVTREYKMFHGAETQPASEVTAQVDFVPPDTVRYKITQTRGSSRPVSKVRMRRALMSDEVRMKKDE